MKKKNRTKLMSWILTAMIHQEDKAKRKNLGDIGHKILVAGKKMKYKDAQVTVQVNAPTSTNQYKGTHASLLR